MIFFQLARWLTLPLVVGIYPGLIFVPSTRKGLKYPSRDISKNWFGPTHLDIAKGPTNSLFFSCCWFATYCLLDGTCILSGLQYIHEFPYLYSVWPVCYPSISEAFLSSTSAFVQGYVLPLQKYL